MSVIPRLHLTPGVYDDSSNKGENSAWENMPEILPVWMSAWDFGWKKRPPSNLLAKILIPIYFTYFPLFFYTTIEESCCLGKKKKYPPVLAGNHFPPPAITLGGAGGHHPPKYVLRRISQYKKLPKIPFFFLLTFSNRQPFRHQPPQPQNEKQKNNVEVVFK